MNLSGIGLLPIGAIRAGAELFVFSKFTGIGIKRIAMKGSVVHGIPRWVLVGMQGLEAGGAARSALAVGSRWYGNCGWGLMPRFYAVVHGYGGIIGVRCWRIHPQRWGRGSRNRCFHSSGGRHEWHAVNHPQGIGRCRGSRDGWCHNFGGIFAWGAVIHPQKCGRTSCWLVGVGGAMQNEHKQLEGLGLAVAQGCQW